VYENSVPAWVTYDEGRVVLTSNGNADINEAYLKDHLGNIRVVYYWQNYTLKTQQVNSYYPFGMNIKGLTANGSATYKPNEYLYNGKMMQDEMGLGWLDYGARFYDPVLGRWHSLDDYAEDEYSETPYSYVLNNPISYLDPDGNFRTKFGAWVYSVFNGGGDIRKDKGGEWFVGNQVKYTGPGGGGAYQRTFDRSGRSTGNDMQLEAQIDAWKTNYNFAKDLQECGIEVNYTDDVNEARMSMLSLSTTVLLPEAIGNFRFLSNVKKVPEVKIVTEEASELHHLLPQAKEFREFFRRAGLNVEDYKIPLGKSAHRLKPNGVHTGADNWNKVWRDFMRENHNASRGEILKQLEGMRTKFGI
jgi:RHS repeat-associated protein